MGTRTYSRRGVTAGQRLAAVDIFGNPIPDRGTVPVLPPDIKQAVENPAKLTPLQTELRGEFAVAMQNNPQSALSDLEPLSSIRRVDYEQSVLMIQALDRNQIKQILAEQESRPVTENYNLKLKDRNPLLLMAIAQYALNPEDREAAIKLIDSSIDARHGLWTTVKTEMLANSLDYQAIFYGKEKFLEKFWKQWSGNNDFNRFGWSNMHEALSYVGPNKDVPPTSDFWSANIIPPKPSPLVLQYLEEQYQETQRKLIEMGVPEEGMVLGRGTRQPRGLSMESWSTDRQTPENFAQMSFSNGRNPGEQRWGIVPRKYIMGTYQTIPTWREDAVYGKQEHMILASAYYENEKGKREYVRTRPRARGGSWSGSRNV